MERILESSSLDEFLCNLHSFINSENDFKALFIEGVILKFMPNGYTEIKGYEGEIGLYFNRTDKLWRYILEQKSYELKKIILIENSRYEFVSKNKILFRFHFHIFFGKFKNLKLDFLLRPSDYLDTPTLFNFKEGLK